MSGYSFMDGFTIGPSLVAAARAAGRPGKVFDWDKAAQIIKDRKPDYAEAGLLTDWPSTAGSIWIDGKPDFDGYTFLGSAWATPALRIGDEDIECWVEEPHAEWDSETKWPASALAIVGHVRPEIG